MKRAARFTIVQPIVTRAASWLTRGLAPIITLHRFRDAEIGNAGHDPNLLRANLAWLRKNKYTPLPVTELIDRLVEGVSVQRTVAFTVDDGYADFVRVAAPIFAEFDCPVTVFLTTGFVDRRQWMWWDAVAVALSTLGRDAEIDAVTEALKRIPELEKRDRVSALLRDAGVELPTVPPPKFAALGWDDVRRLSRRGVTFAPHSVTHPILSRVSDEQSHFEIAESWRRVRDEAGAGAVPVFCYPNGGSGDFSVREEKTIAAQGMRAAVTTRPEYASRDDFSVESPAERFRLPRTPYAEDYALFVQVASGIEHAKMTVRASLGRTSP